MFNLAIIGLGAWGKRLINSVQDNSESVHFKKAVTRSPAKVTEFTAGHGIALGNDYQAILDDPAIDGVVVCSPALAHIEQTLAAIEAGKHVLVIKPLASHRADAEAIYQAADKKGVFVGLGYERCFLPAANELRRRVRAGDLGKIVHVEGNYCVGRYHNMTRDHWKTDAATVPPGAFADHMLYMMIELIGPVEELTASGSHMATDFDVCDTSSVTMRLAGGVSGHLSAIGVTPEFARLHFFGTAGWAEIRGASRFEFAPLKGEREIIEFPAFDTLKCQLESFAAAAQGGVEFPLSPQNAIDAVAAIEAMARSAESGGPVRL
jgi:predicted dehydrogenase